MAKRYARQPGNDQVAKWKAALAEHKRNQRRNRWKRPGPAYRPGMNVTTIESGTEGKRHGGGTSV